MNTDNYASVTEDIIKALENGVCPWKLPWTAGAPKNAITGHVYRGLNVITLAFAGFSDPRWITFKQALALGGNVKKGEKSHKAYFWKMLDRRNAPTPEPGEISTRSGKIPLLKVYSVFNVSQCENLGLAPWTGREHIPSESAEAIIQAMPNQPEIRHGEPRAYYSPSRDLVNLPTPESFDTVGGYYATSFHELAHNADPRIMPRWISLSAPIGIRRTVGSA